MSWHIPLAGIGVGVMAHDLWLHQVVEPQGLVVSKPHQLHGVHVSALLVVAALVAAVA